MTYEIQTSEDKIGWDHLVATSSQGSAFCKEGFLAAWADNYECVIASEGDQVRAGVIIVRTRRDSREVGQTGTVSAAASDDAKADASKAAGCEG